LPSGPFSRLTFDGRGSIRPRWTRDGQSLVYVSRSDSAASSVWRKRADGTNTAELLWKVPGVQIVDALLSGDAQWLIYRTFSGPSSDIFAVRPGRDTVPTPLLTAAFSEYGAALSADGKWLAYVSDESGTDEVYVRPFPNTRSGRWQISSTGGTAPRWSHSGRELFYEGASNDFTAVPVAAGPVFAAGEPRRLFSLSSGSIFGSNGVPYYDLTPDDKRFVMARLSAANQAAGAGQIVVVDNWHAELEARMKAK
jgi:hypothetical protein